MKLRAHLIKIETGFTPVVTINHHDAIRWDLHPRDRVTIDAKKKRIIGVVDVTWHDRAVTPGTIGVLVEAAQELGIKEGAVLDIHPAQKPESIRLIKKKMDGGQLSEKELDRIVKDIVLGALTEVELTYFVAAVSIHDLILEEIVGLTKAIARNGVRFKTRKRPVVDKHCIGGVPGNRTTMIVTPILAALGLTMPKTSSRAITSPAGTADTMECLTKVGLSLDEMHGVVEKAGACLAWGGSLGLAPADDRIIRIEKPMSIDVSGLMMSSVMAKKYSVGATHVLIDIPYGKGAKVRTRAHGEVLKGHFLALGKLLGMKIVATITDGRQPIGNGIGPALEARDVLKVLQRAPDAPRDLREKSLHLAGVLLEFCGKAQAGTGEMIARDLLDSGLAWERMQQIIAAQGAVEMPRLGRKRHVAVAAKSGTVREIDNQAISKLARMAGAPITKGAGLYLHKKVGDKAKKGEPLYTAYSDSEEKIRHVKLSEAALKPYAIR